MKTITEATTAVDGATARLDVVQGKVQTMEAELAAIVVQLADPELAPAKLDQLLERKIAGESRLKSLQGELEPRLEAFSAAKSALEELERKAARQRALEIHESIPPKIAELRARMLAVVDRELMPMAREIAALGMERNESFARAGEQQMSDWCNAGQLVKAVATEISTPFSSADVVEILR